MVESARNNVFAKVLTPELRVLKRKKLCSIIKVLLDNKVLLYVQEVLTHFI